MNDELDDFLLAVADKRLSASIGISIYNGHGERIDKLLSDADAQFYFEKARRDKQHPTSLNPAAAPKKA